MTEERTINEVHLAVLEFREGRYNGYRFFFERPTIEQGYRGILNYVPVHGGITYAKPVKEGGFIYGFDCQHCDDDENLDCYDIEWAFKETEFMYRAISIASCFEKRYLMAKDNKKKAEIIDGYHAEVKKKLSRSFELENNFGAMLGLLCGDL